jgi:mono/diheme cytochrome c family protein
MAIACLVLAACGSTAVPPPSTSPSPRAPAVVDVPMSDPAEYAIERIGREAGKKIFERTGIGDPYRTGVPLPIFLALMKAFPETFGKTTGELADRFGFIGRAPEPASDDLDLRHGLPVGMHATVDPMTSVPFVVTSCAVCHTEKLRWPGGEALVVGLANKRVKIHAYDRAFSEIVGAPGFSVERIGRLATEEAARHKVAWPEGFRDAFTGAAVAALKKRATDRAELHARTKADPPGRVATIESFAVVLGQLTNSRVDFARDVGWAKVPDVIGYAHKTTLSWDSSGQGPIDLLVVEADVAAGVRVEWLEKHPFQGASLGAYLRQPGPRPAFPGKIDRELARRGEKLFDKECARCHGTYAPGGRVIAYDEEAIPVEELGVDPARMMSPTASFERAANDPALTRGYTKFQRSSGYVPPILTNVWARAPYGHAGQWPSLAQLATPPARRPARFVVDLAAPYDLDTVGVTIRPAGAPPSPDAYLHDGTQPGFSVAGHTFLSDLGADAPAVIEFLKTL